MARMPSKRWVDEVKKAIPRTVKYLHGDSSVSMIDAATLLSRQHASFVRLVKKVGRVTTSQFGHSNEAMAWRMACAEILAALQQGGRDGSKGKH